MNITLRMVIINSEKMMKIFRDFKQNADSFCFNLNVLLIQSISKQFRNFLTEINQNDFDPDDVFEEIPVDENSKDEI